MYLRRFSTLAAIGVLTLVYFAAGKLGLSLASLHKSASPVWPPAGIALAALLLLGYRVWPGIFIGAFLVNATTAGNMATSIGIAAGNTLEALCVAALVVRFAGGAQAFDRAQGVFKFALAILLGCVISPTVGITSLAVAGYAEWAHYTTIWITWWLGDVTGELIVAPLIILWSMRPRWRFNVKRDFEVAVLFVLLLVLGEIVFGGWFPISARNYPISFICGPVVIWTAFRLTQRETATAIFILSAIAIWGTMRGFGPFVMETENHSLLILQTSTGILAVTALALAAAMAERRRAEAAIEQQRATVEAANRTKDNFLAMLSHELRTPLTPVMVALEVLELDPSQSSETKASLAMIRRNVELESQLIDDLLDLTRIARGKLRLNLRKYDAHDLLGHAMDIVRDEISSRQLDLSVELNASDHFVLADASRLQQVFWNVLKNASKFTPGQGAVTVRTSNPQPQALWIEISDTGIGIEPQHLERIFDAFEQGGTRREGLGLGLAISKAIVEMHRGSIRAFSDGPGKGAKFVIDLQTAA
jgi:signal transduction histidine kinase